MTNKKNRFFTFCVSLVPGAGEMYMGLYKQGLSLLTAFCALFAMSAFLRLDFMIAFMPVIWLYSFFHTHNLRGMSEEGFTLIEDKYIGIQEINMESWEKWAMENKKPIAVILIFFGLIMLVDMVISFIAPFVNGLLWDLLRSLNHNMVQFAIAIVILAIGIKMLKKDKEAEAQEEAQIVE